jgi:hypothetical protein
MYGCGSRGRVLPSKYEALSLNPNTAKEKEKKVLFYIADNFNSPRYFPFVSILFPLILVLFFILPFPVV